MYQKPNSEKVSLPKSFWWGLASPPLLVFTLLLIGFFVTFFSSFKPLSAGEKVEIILNELPPEKLKFLSSLSGKIVFGGRLSNKLSGEFLLTTKKEENPSHFAFEYEFSEEKEITTRKLDLISK